jgi:hypothetical protein
MNKITCAAIKYRAKGEQKFKVVTGRSHADCFKVLASMNLYSSMRDMDVETQGFLSSESGFVNREEALSIAKAARQVSDDYNRDALFSEFTKY